MRKQDSECSDFKETGQCIDSRSWENMEKWGKQEKVVVFQQDLIMVQVQNKVVMIEVVVSPHILKIIFLDQFDAGSERILELFLLIIGRIVLPSIRMEKEYKMVYGLVQWKGDKFSF